ncbi:MAG: hypothetical protein KF898_05095 [Parachlamydiales bacterium]|nr:hypothetical protein [Candidatus Acheromyda pituitae]
MAFFVHALGVTGNVLYGRPQLPSFVDDFKKLAKFIGSQLPQKEGPAKIESLLTRANQLKSSDGQTQLTQSTRQEILRRKDDLIGQYEAICGKFFKDPSSPIFQAWERFEQAETAYNNSNATPFDQTNPVATDANEEVVQSFQAFLALDHQARGLFQQLADLGSTIKSDPELLHALENEKSANPSSPQSDEEVRHQYVVELMLAAPENPDQALSEIVAKKTKTKLENIQRQVNVQIHNTGIDWNKTTAYGLTAVVVPSAAYLTNLYYS